MAGLGEISVSGTEMTDDVVELTVAGVEEWTSASDVDATCVCTNSAFSELTFSAPSIEPATFATSVGKRAGLSRIFIPIPIMADSIVPVSKLVKPSVKMPQIFFPPA